MKKNVLILMIFIFIMVSAVFAENDILIDVGNKELAEVIVSKKGKVVLLNVWATWCQPCREEFPDLLKLKKSLDDKSFELILVSADFDKMRDEARSFLKEHSVDFTTYRKTGNDMEFINKLNPEWGGSLPGTFLYDSEGILVHSWFGKASFEEFDKEIQKYLKNSEN